MKKSGPKGLFFIFPKVRRERSSPIMKILRFYNQSTIFKPYSTISRSPIFKKDGRYFFILYFHPLRKLIFSSHKNPLSRGDL